MLCAQKANAIVDNFQHAAAQLVTAFFGLIAQQCENQVWFFQAAETRYACLACDSPQFFEVVLF